MNQEQTKPYVFAPAVDIEEGQDELVVWADLPGVKEDDLRITLEQNTLALEASVEPDPRNSWQLAHREYQEGGFRRVFTLSEAIDQAKINATLKNGVLKLVLPKTEPAKPRRITVKTT